MSADWHPGIVVALAAAFEEPIVYIEIGCGDGHTFNQVLPHCAEAHAVDIAPKRIAGGRIWELGSDEFWGAYSGPLAHLIFIDGDHSEAQVRRDVDGALDSLREDGLMVMHDTWPSKRDAPGLTGTAWRIAAELERNPGLQTLTIPVWPGLTLARRVTPRLFEGG